MQSAENSWIPEFPQAHQMVVPKRCRCVLMIGKGTVDGASSEGFLEEEEEGFQRVLKDEKVLTGRHKEWRM